MSHKAEHNGGDGDNSQESALASLVRVHNTNGAFDLDTAIDDFLTVFLAGEHNVWKLFVYVYSFWCRCT